MRQGLGWGAAVAVALAAAIGISSHFGARPPGETSGPAKFSGQSVTKPPSSADLFAQGPCVDIEEHLQAFLLNGESDSIAAPPSCYGLPTRPPQDQVKGKKLREKAQNLRFVIATLPDPLHTHFPLSFDRLMEAIQQGATDEHYIYDSSWLPWETEEDTFALIQDQDKADDRKQAREDQPGILLFRRNPGKDETDKNPCKGEVAEVSGENEPKPSQPYECGLVVFIVGEEPTQGIHRIQFQNAAAWIKALEVDQEAEQGAEQSLYKFPDRILGPSFSGSLPSLANTLLDLREKAKVQDKPDVTIYSGSVTSRTLVDWFANSTEGSFSTHLWSFQQSDDRALDLYCRFLHRSGFNLDRLAIVSEDETAFGNDLPHDKQGIVDQSCEVPNEWPAKLFYPRDISALRTAYQQQSIFNQPAEQASPDTGRRTLTADIADPQGRQHDTIRNYSGDQTALSQEAVLQQIVSQLRIHKSQYIMLRCSNPLDELFLSHYLRLTYPQGRIVIMGADLLLRRESGAARLSGIMTLSTYPLLPWEPHWTRAKDDPYSHAHRVFPQDGAEGTYVAARYLLHLPSPDLKLSSSQPHFLPVSADPSFRIPDYATPFWIRQQASGKDLIEPPPVWLSVLGRNDFWPVAALNDNSLRPGTRETKPSIGERARRFLGELSSATVSLWRVLMPFAARTAYGDSTDPKWPDWPGVPLSMKIAVTMVFVWAIFHFACCLLPSVMTKPSHRAYFVSVGDNCKTHRTLLVIGSLALSSTATVLGWGYGAMSPDGAPLTHPWIWLSLLPLLWCIVGLSLAVNIWKQCELRCDETSDAAAKRGGEEASLNKSAEAAAKHKMAPARMARRTASRRFDDFQEALRRKRRFLWRPLLAFAAGTVGFYFLLYLCTEAGLTSANRIPTYWRNMSLTSGVSPLIPLLAPAVGIYLWFWYSLQGLAFFGPDHPVLPPAASLKLDGPARKWMRMFSHKCAARSLEEHCKPLAGATLWVGVSLLLILIPLAFFIAGGVPIRSLGAWRYSILICVSMDICVSAMLANAWRLVRVWLLLRRLLTLLYRMRLRRSMAAFPGVSWGSVWNISGNVLEMRYMLLTREAECATHLQNSLEALKSKSTFFIDEPNFFPDVFDALAKLKAARKNFAEWYSKYWNDSNAFDQHLLKEFQTCLARTAGVLLAKVLVPAWGDEDGPHPDCASSKDEAGIQAKDNTGLTEVARLEPHIRYAEQLVCYVYLGFVQNILGRMRSLALSSLWLFIAATVAMASYPFDPRPAVSAAMALLFVALGAAIVFVYAQVHRDPIISLVTNTTPGELGGEFWLKLLGFGAGPALGLLATIFPQLSDILFSWIQPGISAAK
jgi:hypothetical protein